jgi:excisionase family DNA binding protein
MNPEMTVRQAAEQLKVHENTVRNWMDGGLLAFNRLPTGQRRPLTADVQRLAMERRSDSERLSRMLFEARERIEMHAELVEQATGRPDDWGRRLVRQIDEYRAERGWSPHGFGGE